MLDVNDFLPSWSRVYSPAEMENDLANFKFTGPGWYIARNGETLLVVPLDPVRDSYNSAWKTRWPKDMKFRVYRYAGNPFGAFNAIVNATVREDKRK